METNFKVGDKVKVINTEIFTDFLKVGDIGEIILVNCNGVCINFNGYPQIISGYNKPEKYIELIEEEFKLNKITLSEFLDPKTKIVVNTRTKKEYKQFIKACKKRGKFKRFGMNYYKIYKEDTCIAYGIFNAEGYCPKQFYIEYGCKIYNFDEVDLEN